MNMNLDPIGQTREKHSCDHVFRAIDLRLLGQQTRVLAIGTMVLKVVSIYIYKMNTNKFDVHKKRKTHRSLALVISNLVAP